MSKIVLISIVSFFTVFLIAQPVTTIEGVAPTYAGKEVNIFKFKDFLSRVTEPVAKTTVTKDSTFKVSFYANETQKLKVEIGENHFLLYTEPNGNYKVFVRGRSPYVSKKAKGVNAEFFFLGLDSTDVNYKIIMYDDQQLTFLENNYTHQSMKSAHFVSALDSFKEVTSQQYAKDSSMFLKTYVRFSIAALDDLPFQGHRNRYEKYDFYIKPEPVWYKNDRYMDYIKRFYDDYYYQLSNEVNQKFYKGVVQSSPTVALNSLSQDYAMKNIRLREMVMIKMLSDVFYTGDFPKTNILTMLDSLSNHALFEENKEIASSIKFRLLDLVSGSKMPNFNVIVNGERKSKNDYRGNHVYIQFVEKGLQRSLDDLPLLHPIQEKYSKYVDFITVLVTKEGDSLLNDPSPFIKKYNIAWDFSVITDDDPILKKLNAASFPYYMLMDATGNVVSAPALSPQPNNEYETIENILYQIQRRRKAMDER